MNWKELGADDLESTNVGTDQLHEELHREDTTGMEVHIAELLRNDAPIHEQLEYCCLRLVELDHALAYHLENSVHAHDASRELDRDLYSLQIQRSHGLAESLVEDAHSLQHETTFYLLIRLSFRNPSFHGNLLEG